MRGVGVLALVATLAAVSCVEPDLGDVPFYCNHGQPACPEGYQCQDFGKVKVCVRQGATYQPDVKVVGPDAGQDVGQITFDGIKDTVAPRDVPGDLALADVPQVPDMYKPDLPPKPKDTGPAPDVPHLGCQSNAECKLKDTQYPCCCPTPLLPFVWSCLPLCLNPICLPL